MIKQELRSLQKIGCTLVMALGLGLLTSCSEKKIPEPPQPLEGTHHFDIFMTIGENGGMTKGKGTIVKSVPKLNAGIGFIDIKNSGVEFRSGDNTYTLELIAKGKYYYQVPSSNDRFSKLLIKGNKVVVVQEQPFKQNTYSSRKYAHTWLDDDTLLVMAANGDGSKIIWTKLRATDMSILSEGVLDDLPLPQGDTKETKVFNTSGVLSYNPKAHKLYYFYYGKDKGRGGKATSNFFTATINPEIMQVETNIKNSLAREMAGSAYGNLLQDYVMYDEEGNLYLAAFTETDGIEKGQLLRLSNGKMDFDASYEGFKNANGKLLTVQYLGHKKALIYVREDALGKASTDFSYYYAILDLNTGIAERMQYGGEDLPYSSGRFSQRSVVYQYKAYVGINPKGSNPCIYVYDIATGDVVKGADIAEGHSFDAIRLVENDK